MRNLNALNKYRVPLGGEYGDEKNGAFQIAVKKKTFSIIASNGEGWEHVSVSSPSGPPSWKVMQYIKELFFKDDEVVMQLHPKKADYVNNHDFCLHLWRPLEQTIPLPPTWLVGVKD